MAGFSVVQAPTAAAGSRAVEAAGVARSSSRGRIHESTADDAATNNKAAGGVLAPSVYSPAVAHLLQAPDLVPVKTFVTAALAAKLRGNAVNYRHIVDTIRTKDDLETLPRVFLALSSCITTVTADPDRFKELLGAIFKYDWSGGPVTMETFTDLLAHLVSAKSTFLHPTLQMLARSLAAAGPPQAPAAPAAAAEGAGGVAVAVTVVDAASEAARQRKEAIHAALRAVLALVPAGVPELYPALEEAFPHRRLVGAGSLVHYARELLRVAEYLPSLRDRLLALLVERCLEIDVEIKIDDSGEARVQDSAGEQHLQEALVVSEHVFLGFDDPSLRANLEGEEEDCHQQGRAAEPEAPEVVVDEMAEMLDSVMLLLFEYLEGQLSGSDEKPQQQQQQRAAAGRLFDGLAPTLEGPILATHHCKYVQFLLFFLAARDPLGRVPGLLLDRLLGVALDDDAPAVARQAALAYTASFLVRARALRRADVVRALVALVGAAEAHLVRSAPDVNMLRLVGDLLGDKDDDSEEEEGEEGTGWGQEEEGDGEEEQGEEEEEAEAVPTVWGARGRHGLFYAICQAVFYVVAFHHSTHEGEDVLGVVPHGDAAEPGLMEQQQRLRLQLGRLACCPLRPLDKCLESVKREFLRLARRHALVPVGALAGLGREEPLQQGQHHLESFFPFDPYVLRRSSRFVATPDVYRYWQALPRSEHDEDEEDEHDGVPAGLDEEVDSEGEVSSSDSDSGSSDGSGSGSESDSEGEEAEGPEMFYGENSAIAMSVASVASGTGLRLAAAAYVRRSTSRGSMGSNKSGRRKRERADSMEFDDDYSGGAGGHGGDGAFPLASSASLSSSSSDSEDEGLEGSVDGSVDGSLDACDAGHEWSHLLPSAEVAAACGAALAYAQGRKSPRVRKESVSSVGSW